MIGKSFVAVIDEINSAFFRRLEFVVLTAGFRSFPTIQLAV